MNDSKSSQLEQVNLPKDLQVKLSELPQIISNKTKLILDLEMKVNEANEHAESAKKQAEEIKGYEEKSFLGYKYKVGDTKENIESTQSVVKLLVLAQKESTEALKLSFEFQKELANTAEYLFYLGCYNIATNESMIANLNKQLRGEGTNGVQLSENVKEQFKNVVLRLRAQKDVLYRQQQIEEKSKQQENKLKSIETDIQNFELELVNKENAISLLHESLNCNNGIYTKKFEEISSLLENKDDIDKEQSRLINDLKMEIKETNNAIQNLSRKLYFRTLLIVIIVILSVFLGIVHLYL